MNIPRSLVKYEARTSMKDTLRRSPNSQTKKPSGERSAALQRVSDGERQSSNAKLGQLDPEPPRSHNAAVELRDSDSGWGGAGSVQMALTVKLGRDLSSLYSS